MSLFSSYDETDLPQIDTETYSLCEPVIPKCYRQNLPPTSASQARLRNFSANKKEDLTFVQKRITDTMDLVHASETAIKNLERTIQHTHHVVSSMEYSLHSLESVRDDMRALDSAIMNIASNEEPQSFRTCHAVIAYIGVPSESKELKSIPDQTSQLLYRVHNLRRMKLEMEQELLDWRMELEYHTGYLKQLKDHRYSLVGVINGIKKILSPVRTTPSEIWVKIFGYCITDRDLEASHHSLPSPLLLGHVCSFWRQIIFETPNLWERFDIYTQRWWPKSILGNLERTKQAAPSNGLRYHFFGHFNPRWASQVQQFTSGGYYSAYSNLQRQDFAEVPSDVLEQFSAIKLHVGTVFNFSVYTPPTTAIKTLTVTGSSSGWGSELLTFLNRCSSAEELVLENIWLVRSTSISMPNLRRLRFRIDRFTPFDVSPFLHLPLRELDIRHDSSDTVILGPGAVPRLTHLQHLAVTPYEHPLLTHILAPNLKIITLYPANAPTVVTTSSPGLQSANDLNSTLAMSFIISLLPKVQKVEEIIFFEWTIQSTMDCAYVLEKILSVPSPLQHIRFDRCHLKGPTLISLLAKANRENINTEELLATTVPELDDTDSPLLSASPKVNSLAELTLSCCTGLTRGECDVLASTVGKLNVYV